MARFSAKYHTMNLAAVSCNHKKIGALFFCTQTFESAALSSSTIYVADWLSANGTVAKRLFAARAIAKVAAADGAGVRLLQGKTFGKAANGVIRNYLWLESFTTLVGDLILLFSGAQRRFNLINVFVHSLNYKQAEREWRWLLCIQPELVEFAFEVGSWDDGPASRAA